MSPNKELGGTQEPSSSATIKPPTDEVHIRSSSSLNYDKSSGVKNDGSAQNTPSGCSDYPVSDSNRGIMDVSLSVILYLSTLTAHLISYACAAGVFDRYSLDGLSRS